MPTETFTRLPAEKRARFLNAAWEEFTRVPFPDVSINRIVRCAGIPRGSFYQYFSDRDELFAYLLEDVKSTLGDACVALIRSQDGDLFRTQLTAFDHVLGPSFHPAPALERCTRLLQVNPGIDLQFLLKDPPESGILGRLCQEVDLRCFRIRDPEALRQTFFLALLSLSSAVADSLAHPERKDICRRELETRLRIIQYGCLQLPADAEKESLS